MDIQQVSKAVESIEGISLLFKDYEQDIIDRHNMLHSTRLWECLRDIHYICEVGMTYDEFCNQISCRA